MRYINTNTGEIFTAEEIEVLFNQFKPEIEDTKKMKFNTFTDYLDTLIREDGLREVGDKVYTADRETGTFIDEFETVEDAKAAIEEYEEYEKEEGVYEPDFYDIVDENHCSLI